MSDEKKEIKKWQDRISTAEKHYDAYHRLVKETREYYRDKASENKKSGRYNIFWSSIETLKPFLYFKQPKPYVERNNKTASPVEALACQILEKALEWDLAQFDFDSVMKYARNDFLISGTGIVWEKYRPQFQDVVLEDGIQAQVKSAEQVDTVYLDPAFFIADCDKVGIWEDVTWIAKKIFMTKQSAIDTFGENIAFDIVDTGEKDYQKKEICVYEIWDKSTKKVYWLSKENKSKFLKVADDPLGLKGFFPCPKPIFATMTNDSIIPVPDYSMIKEMLAELDGVNDRMRLTLKALKVSGCYDNSFPELKGILNKDVTLISVSDFQKLKDNGGIRGIIDFAPIDQYVAALDQLAARRQDIIAKIFDVTGVSDIMRGNSDPNETATAVTQKTNFGTLRNQDRQNDMQRFIGDLFRIKAEIICEQFAAETLAGFASPEQQQNPELLRQAVLLLKTEKMRGMMLGVETDIAFNQDQEAAKTLEAVNTITEMVNAAFQAVSAQPLLLPLYKQMILSVVGTLPKSRPFEAVIEQAFTAIGQDLNKPDEPETPPVDPRVEVQAQKNRQEFDIKKEQNALKAREIALKEQSERTKLMLTNKEIDAQVALKREEIAQKGETNTNVTTGYVRSFE